MLQHLAMKAVGRVAAFGDPTIALTVAAVLWARLAAHGRWNASLWWAASVAGCVATTWVLKLGFLSGDLSLSGVALENPSGHTAMATMVYGSVALVISGAREGWPRRALLMSGWLVAAAVGLSLYVLGAHTAPDVLAGWALGGAWASSFAWLGWRDQEPVVGRPLAVIFAIAIAGLGLQGLERVAHFSPRDWVHLPPAHALARAMPPRSTLVAPSAHRTVVSREDLPTVP